MNRELLNKFLENETSEAENKHIHRWFEDNVDSDLAKEYMMAVWNKPTEDLHPSLLAEVLEKLHQKIPIWSEDALESRTVPFPIQYLSNSYIRIAGTILVFLLAGLGAYLYFQDASLITIHSDYGKITRITLPDHSRVVLNANSTIQYEKHWKPGQDRKVFLKGEGYFEVTHQPDHVRFLVQTEDNFKVEVLGTRFNVLKRKSDTQVVLHSGQVKLSYQQGNKIHQYVMKPGESAQLKSSTTPLFIKQVDPAIAILWMKRKLIFQETTIREIKSLLEDIYGIEVVIHDSELLNKKCTGSVPNENADILLEGLKAIFNLKIDQKDGKVFISQ